MTKYKLRRAEVRPEDFMYDTIYYGFSYGRFYAHFYNPDSNQVESYVSPDLKALINNVLYVLGGTIV